MMDNRLDYLDIGDAGMLDKVWINPVGGLGDAVMVSSAMKAFVDVTGRRLKMVRRSAYTWIFSRHPGVSALGNPPADAMILTTNYWSRPEFGSMPALELVYRIFGLDSRQIAVTSWMPDTADDASLKLAEAARLGSRPTVIISPASDSPRKMMSTGLLVRIAEGIRRLGLEVIMTGTEFDPHIPGVYTLAGATRPRQLATIVSKAVAVVSPDSFIVHLAQALGVPAVVFFGPTDARVYGYDGNVNLSADISGCPCRDNCLGPHVPDNYITECPLGKDSCVDTIKVEDVVAAVDILVKQKKLENKKI